jgi:uncharacterized protein (TIGR02453 family)
MSKIEVHFTPELFRFMRQLKKNNKPEWFKKKRDDYIEVARDPMLRFISDFGPHLRRISPHFVADPRPQGGSMFRIYRDIRFSKDKKPYKTFASAQFRHERGKDVHAPGFYLHLGADEVFAGSGIWHPDGPSLAKIRNAIVEQPARWKRILSAKKFRDNLRLSGDSLKRAPRGFDPEHPLIEDLKRKDFIAVTDLDEKAACAPGFIDSYTQICRAGAPLVKFLTEALELDW